MFLRKREKRTEEYDIPATLLTFKCKFNIID